LHSVEAEDFCQLPKQTRQTAHLQQAQQKAQAFLGDHPQQPADVVPSCTQHRVQRIAFSAFEVAAVHSVICFEVPDDRLDRLPPFEQPALFIRQPLLLATVFDLEAQVSPLVIGEDYPKKQASLNIDAGVLIIGNDPES
jgi:hypothetical protein